MTVGSDQSTNLNLFVTLSGLALTGLSVILTVVLAYTRLVARHARLEVKLNIMWSVFRRKLGAEIRAEDEEEFFR